MTVVTVAAIMMLMMRSRSGMPIWMKLMMKMTTVRSICIRNSRYGFLHYIPPCAGRKKALEKKVLVSPEIPRISQSAGKWRSRRGTRPLHTSGLR